MVAYLKGGVDKFAGEILYGKLRINYDPSQAGNLENQTRHGANAGVYAGGDAGHGETHVPMNWKNWELRSSSAIHTISISGLGKIWWPRQAAAPLYELEAPDPHGQRRIPSFQLGALRENQRKRGWNCPYLMGPNISLLPKKSIEIQMALGADIIMAFDECAPYPADRSYVKRTPGLTDGAKRYRGCPQSPHQALFGIAWVGRTRTFAGMRRTY